jgi:hypothetical protein
MATVMKRVLFEVRQSVKNLSSSCSPIARSEHLPVANYWDFLLVVNMVTANAGQLGQV